MEALLASGAKLSNTTHDPGGVLHAAAYRGHADVIDFVVARPDSPDVNALNAAGATPLALACTKGHADAVEALLDAGAGHETPDATGCTPWLRAARSGQAEVMQRLERCGANKLACDRSGRDAAAMCPAAFLETHLMLLTPGTPEWSPETHSLWPRSFRRAVRTVLLTADVGALGDLDAEPGVLLRIIGFTATP